MNPDYKPLEARHRILSAVEDYWKRYPYKPLGKLLTDLVGTSKLEEARDEDVLRLINKQ